MRIDADCIAPGKLADLVVIDLREKTFRFVSNPDGEIRIHGTLSRDGRFVAYETDDGRIMRAGLFE